MGANCAYPNEVVCPSLRPAALHSYCCLRPDDLRVIKELPIKAARDCCFSNGGQYFAAVNGNTGGLGGMWQPESGVGGAIRGRSGRPYNPGSPLPMLSVNLAAPCALGSARV